MLIKDVEQGFLIRLEKDERVLATLTDFCTSRGINAGYFHAIGAVKNSEIGYYDLAKKEYFFKKFSEDREVASMTGNIALVDNKPFIHAHAVLSAGDETLLCIGGHVKEMEVAVTLEVYLTPFPARLERVLDNSIGLKLLNI